MWAQFQLIPEQASTIAPELDALTLLLVAVSVFFSVLIAVTLFVFAVKYRRRYDLEIPKRVKESNRLELAWTVIPLLISLVIFGWGARLYFFMSVPPDDSMEIYVVGRQWMWHMQHMGGQRENQELHVPAGRSIKLVMTSQDVIHDFAVPDFRVRQDVIPGRYTVMWFNAPKPGKHRLFCAEYCGTDHSRMVGWIHVMDPRAFQEWLASPKVDGSLASEGRKLFLRLQCVTCHSSDARAQGPHLEGLFGRSITLQDGAQVVADETYIRESILDPDAKIAAGFRPIMPPFRGQVTENEMLQLVSFIKALRPGQIPLRTEQADRPSAYIAPSPPDSKKQ